MVNFRAELCARGWYVKGSIERYFAFHDLFSTNFILLNSVCNLFNYSSVLLCIISAKFFSNFYVLDLQRLNWIADTQQQYKFLLQEYHQLMNVCATATARSK